jgi:hypothetical protein
VVRRHLKEPLPIDIGYLLVIDESGEDYLYPASYFVRVELPQEAEQAIAAPG